jgi:hypothetical protein
MPVPICRCSRCLSWNTVAIDQGRHCDYWYCYDCRRGFEVPVTDSVEPSAAR